MNIKKLGIIVMILFFIVVTSVPVLAITDYQVIVSTDKTEVTPADTVKVTVSLKDIQPETGLGTFFGRLTYDTEVFETVTQEDVVGATGWGTVLYNPDGGYLVVERAAGDGVKTDNAVLVITLKVKADATIKNAQVTISEISCSTGEEDLTAVDAGISIAITTITLSSDQYQIQEEDKIITKISPNTTVSNLISNITTNATIQVYDKEGNVIEAEEIVGTSAKVRLLQNGAEYEVAVTGDLNGDGKITGTDLLKLKKHIVKLELLQRIYLKAADVNFSRSITATDLLKVKQAIVGLIKF